jgi:hypothetical protein
MTEVLDNALTNLFVYCTNNPITHYDPMGFWKIPLSSLIGILQCVGLNPIGSALVALGLYKFRAYVIGKFTLLVAKLTSMFGPWVQTALTILAAVSGVFILGPIAVAFFDAIVQKKKGVEITIKKTWFGMPYGISAGVY